MKKLLIATTNPAKLKDYQNLLKDFNFELLALKDFEVKPPEEVGKNFEETAINKAKYYFAKTGVPTLVDDGGLEIDALNGEPGVKSHRWLGHEMSDEEIVSEVIKRMEKKEDRTCRFVVVVALAMPFGIITSHGDILGKIAEKPSQKLIKGYPYRSVVYLPNYGKYFCEIDDKEHEILNHRKHAIEKIQDFLQEISR